MTEEDLVELRAQAAVGDLDAVASWSSSPVSEATLTISAASQRRQHDAMDLLVEAAGEREDLDELRHLAASGNTDAADVLAELTDDEDDGEDDDDEDDDTE